MLYCYLNVLFIFSLINFTDSLFAQYVDSEVMKVRTESFLNIKRMITGRKRVSLNTSDIRLPLKRGADMEACYAAFLENEHEKILHNIEEKFDIHIPYKRETSDFYQNHASASHSFGKRKKNKILKKQKPSGDMVKKAREVFALFTDEPEKIRFIKESDGTNNPAAANGSEISIDEKEMNHYDEDTQKYLLAHEYIHYIKKHVEEQERIKDCLKKKYGKLTNTMRTELFKLSRFCEVDSDIEGALRGGACYIEGYRKFGEKFISKDVYVTHPSNNDRKKEAELLSRELGLISEHQISHSN